MHVRVSGTVQCASCLQQYGSTGIVCAVRVATMMLPEAVCLMDAEENAADEDPSLVIVLPVDVAHQFMMRATERLEDFPPDLSCDRAFGNVTQ